MHKTKTVGRRHVNIVFVVGMVIAEWDGTILVVCRHPKF